MAPTRFVHPEDEDALIFYLGEYVPVWWQRANHMRDGYSMKVLDLKDSQRASLASFTALLSGQISKEYRGVTAVPSHDPAVGIGTGIRLLAKQVAAKIGAADGRQFLRRIIKVDKLATGGARKTEIHLRSIVAENPHAYRDGRVLLLDDVMTTGNSLVACRRLLLEAGASEVICVALAKTKH